jgi:biopolymer transport protein ExbD
MATKFVSGRAGSGVKSEINITPLVDVVLVLLIIFMVIGPMIQPGIDVVLPVTAKPETIEKKPTETAIITLALGTSPDEAVIYYGEEKKALPQDRLAGVLDEIHEREPGRAILIKSDRRLNFGPVKQVMRACNRRGFESVSLVTSKEGS